LIWSTVFITTEIEDQKFSTTLFCAQEVILVKLETVLQFKRKFLLMFLFKGNEWPETGLLAYTINFDLA